MSLMVGVSSEKAENAEILPFRLREVGGAWKRLVEASNSRMRRHKLSNVYSGSKGEWIRLRAKHRE
ncbi:hypothetical protein CW706_05010 [Candidatus Bathyarchaeota archaeon]|nr:MAG: hypothetical protein CW706_05010 [Candidatus Bathyarchaeota archaeon]